MRLNRFGLYKTAPPLILAGVVALLINSCGGSKNLRKEGPYWYDNDQQNIDKPEKTDPKLAWQSMDRTFFNQGEQFLDMERNFGKLFGSPKQAVNINSYDEVPNSSWFTNRHGLQRLTPEEISAGKAETPGPDTNGPWLVFRPKTQGTTAGFWIEDSRGDQYIIKFDPKENPEMATAAAAMGSRYFHACGYNVPQETIVYWNPDILKIKEGVKFTDPASHKREFTDDDLKAILAKTRRAPDGRIRSLASRALPNVRGPFSYDGTRKDDPNDVYRHEHRREFRGLYVIASLVNHYDTKDQNTLDTYEENNGRWFLKHYLIDFGSTFGSDGNKPKPKKKGYANVFDLRDVFVSLITFGLKTWPWEHAKPVQHSSIGYFESELFEPNKFDPIVPNPAFENMTNRDAYWGAKIVMAFRDDDLRALVKSGQYSNPEAEAFLLKTLIERRDKIGRHWFGKVNPLDYFSVDAGNESLRISFKDLAVEYGLEEQAGALYRSELKYRRKTLLPRRQQQATEIKFSAADLNLLKGAFKPDSPGNDVENHLYQLDIRTKRDKGSWSKPTRLWLWFDDSSDRFSLVGIEHLD